jgi:hypothetical protein
MTETAPWLTVKAEGERFALKVDGKALAAAVVNTTKTIVTGKTTELLGNAGEAFKSLGFKPDPASLAGFLFRRAMTHALEEAIAENRNRFPETLPEESQTMEFLSQTALSRTPTYLNREFFLRPHRLPFVEEVGKLLAQWFGYFDVPAQEAQRIAGTVLPRRFLYALNAEWRENSDFYKPILTADDTPFEAASENEYYWTQYRLYLINRFEAEPMFGEEFGLEQVYVPLRAYRERRESESGDPAGSRGRIVRAVVDLDEEVWNWIERPGKRDTLRVISGEPGSGKSSFGRRLAARLAEAGRYVLFVPLHRLDTQADIPAAVYRYVRDNELLRHNPLDIDQGDTPLLLIFDGLDEIADQERASRELAEKFVIALKHWLSSRNETKFRVQAILTGREIVVQTQESELRDVAPVLHVLPYYLPKDEIDPSSSPSRPYRYEDPQYLLADDEGRPRDQRDTWWNNYRRAKGRAAGTMPEALRRPDLQEITAQPLLNYLVAQSHEQGRIDFAEESNINAVYADLLSEVYNRCWGEGNPHAMDLSPEQFCEILEEIGLAVWHGNGRTATLEAITAYCAGQDVCALKAFRDGAEQGLARTLTAFYFRRTDVYGVPTFEFTHKSFGEYLTARRIVRAMQQMHRLRKARDADRYAGWDEEAALVHWAKICGPAALDPTLLGFLRREVELQARRTDADAPGPADLQATLCPLIAAMLRSGMPMHHSDLKLTTFGKMDRQARCAETALLAALNACARVTQQLSSIEWSERGTFGEWLDPARAGEWLRRLCGQIYGSHPLALDCLSYLNLDQCMLYGLGSRFFERGLDGRVLDIRVPAESEF